MIGQGISGRQLLPTVQMDRLPWVVRKKPSSKFRSCRFGVYCLLVAFFSTFSALQNVNALSSPVKSDSAGAEFTTMKGGFIVSSTGLT